MQIPFLKNYIERASQADVANTFQRSLHKARTEREAVARRDFKTKQQLQLI